MSYEANTGLNVHNHYGARTTGKSAGTIKTVGAKKELVISLDSEVIGNGGPILVPVTIPAGSNIDSVFLNVTEAFALGGTTPGIEIGTDTSEATNGVSITEAEAEATGYTDLTGALSGTWAAPLAADTVVGIALSGTSPTVGAGGAAEVIISYTHVA